MSGGLCQFQRLQASWQAIWRDVIMLALLQVEGTWRVEYCPQLVLFEKHLST